VKPVTLSFDNGPDPAATPRVLDILSERGIRTTFFLVGERLAGPEGRRLAERAHAKGHWIGNHSWSHGTPLGRMTDAAASVAEIADTQAALGPLAHPRRFFRPVGGGGALGRHLLSSAAADHLRREGFTCVLWNCVPGDWNRPEGWPDRALAEMATLDHPVVVVHDVAGACVDDLPYFLDRLGEAGFAPVQDFPADAVVMDRGVPAAAFDGCVAAAPGAA
jgi:peptidoglycan-N-acetylglucosamine deacetylase